MKKSAIISLILLLMIGTVATLNFMAKEKDRNYNDALSENLSKKRTLTMTESECSLGVGETHLCQAVLSDGSMTGSVIWSSTDNNVATVDSIGNVTAHSKGEAIITAFISVDLKCSVKVIVYDDVEKSVVSVINKLAERGSDEDYSELISLNERLSKSKNINAKNYAALLTALLDYSSVGSGNTIYYDDLWDNLNAALVNSGVTINQTTLRRAVLSVCCQGEKNAYDLTLSFTGDCTLAYFNEKDKANLFPAVYKNSGSETYPFDLTRNVFEADDITMINLECALTDSKKHKDKQFYFRGKPSYVNILSGSSVEAVTVANNHSHDYLEDGFNDTINNLADAGIRYTSYDSPAAISKDDYRVAMLSVSMVSTSYTAEFKNKIEEYINLYNNEKTIIVVNVHWGTEGADTPSDWQISAAHSMIDAGADLIIGHHPHCLQGIEKYNDGYIAYSLGNFCFSGNISASYPNTVILRISFSEASYGGLSIKQVTAVPCYNTSSGSRVNNFQPTVRFGSDGDSTIAHLLSISKNIEGGINSINYYKIP